MNGAKKKKNPTDDLLEIILDSETHAGDTDVTVSRVKEKPSEDEISDKTQVSRLHSLNPLKQDPLPSLKKPSGDSTLQVPKKNLVDVTVTHSSRPPLQVVSTQEGYKQPEKKSQLGGSTSSPARLSEDHADLRQAESLKMAQQTILRLEREVEKLVHENHELSSAATVFRNRVDELAGQLDRLERKLQDQSGIYTDEKNVLENQLASKKRQVGELEAKNKELESRIQVDLRQVRSRERELENRLEIAKLENVSLLRSKDELILDLKKRIEQMEGDQESYRMKAKDLLVKLDEKQDQIRRVMKALKLAVTMLEAEENTEGSDGKGSGDEDK